MNDMDELAGVITGLVMLVLTIVVIYIIRKEELQDKPYDERQLTLRAEGYKRGFIVTVIVGMLAVFLVEVELVPLACATLLAYISLLAGIVTFAVFCIVKDVFFRIGQKETSYIILCAVIVLTDGISAATRIADGSLLENGVPTFASCNALLMALVFLVILIALLVRRFAGERDE